MPIASYRSFAGVAKESANTTLAASTAVGATSVTIAAAAVPASYTIFIWDGVNSESRAVSAGGGTTTLTVSALTYAHSANVYITAQPTASVGPTDYISIETLDAEDKYAPLEDKGLRGSAVELYNIIQGPAMSELSIGGNVYSDTIGYFLGSLLGASDFTGGTPNTHAFSVMNTTTGQPATWTLYESDGTITRAHPLSRISEIGFKFDGEGLFKFSAKAIGMVSGIVANPTTSYSTVTPMANWVCTASIGGTAVQTLISGEMNIKRGVNPIQTLDGTQHPARVYAGSVTVDGKLTFVIDDETELTRMNTNSQPPLDLVWTVGSGASQQYVQIHCTKAAYTTAKKNRGADYVQLDVNYSAIANTTDATTAGTGYSPLKATIKNSKATGTFV